ncbi:FecCD family ABC transporter permease [Piscibacillus halophilus]|uniref:Iron complex transport system permease protein n=1 Tax=Piscibacillus halophilus TaxID=571933 RepID=A0A1H9LN16_9BACI|nr:iron ABC transporter permease [Piscibacillus halophilus]SER12607.1 iron complex transport system permease protein [Piscibacillus halophilus]
MKRLQNLPLSTHVLVNLILLFISLFVAIWFGAANTRLIDVWNAISSNSEGEYYSILREIRIPRVLAAFFVGSALAVAGAIMQGVTRNPLADPGLLGITAGANAALAVTFAFIPNSSYLSLILASFVGAGIGMILVIGISAATNGGLSPLKLVLAGAAITAFLQAIADGVGLLFQITKDVSMWTAGGLVGTSWNALIVTPVIIVGLVISLLMGKVLTTLSINEDVAVGLGQKTKLVKAILLVLVVVLAGAAVALVGNLAFVGLMIPHIVRFLVGTDYQRIIPICILVGGLFMILADFIGRTVNAPFEVPVVAIVAVIGLPFFLLLVRKGGRQFES